MRKAFCVAGHTFSVEVPDNLYDIMQQYYPFIAEEPQEGPIFCLECVDSIPQKEETLLYDQPTDPGETKIVLSQREDGILAVVRPTSNRPIAARVLFSPDYKTSRLEIVNTAEALFALNNALMLQYAFSTAQLGTLEMHASVVKSAGKGYLFLAKSGTGKSTHSQLWLKNIPDTTLLNDDNPIVRVHQDGSIIVYGSPWSGKTPCYINDSCPVGAFVLINRAPANSAEPLSLLASYATVYSSSSGFKADQTMADGLHSTIESIAVSGICYQMNCLPDNDAAIVCASTVRK